MACVLAAFALAPAAGGADQRTALDPDAAEAEVRPLGAGAIVRERLALGASRLFTVELAAGDLLEIVVDQRGIDVATEVRGPDGATLLAVDRAIGARGPEPLALIAAEPGLHQVEVRAAKGDLRQGVAPEGEYELAVTALRPASPDDRVRAGAVGRVYAARTAIVAKDGAAARAALAQAAELWRRLGEPAWQAEVSELHCRLERERRDWTAAVAPCAETAELFAAAGDVRRRGMALRTLGVVLSNKGDVTEAIARFDDALTLARAADDPRTGITVLFARGQARQIRDDVQGALDDYGAALELARSLGDRRLEAHSLHDLGVLHRVLGAPVPAAERLEQAEAAFTELGDDRSRAASLNQLGHLAQEARDLPRALALYEEALILRREVGDRRGEAVTLTKIAGLHRERGELAAALAAYTAARELLADLEVPWVRANTLVAVAALHEEAGRREEARRAYAEAAETYRGIGDATGEAEGLLGLARNRPPGAAAGAVAAAAAGLALLETVRARALREDLRTSFFVSVRGHYDAVIDLMMELDGARPGEGWAAAALGVVERARARALLDRLGETAAAFRLGVDPALIEEERALRDELSAAETRRLRLLEVDVTAPQVDVTAAQIATVERNVRHLAEKLEAARARIRAASPRYAAATRPPILAGDEIGRLLDPDTQLLAYHLGEERGHVWLVDPEGVTAAELPPRVELEELAREAHRLLVHSRRPSARAALDPVLCRLGESLLGPLADRLDADRLVVVPDGALHYLPFAALPQQEVGGCPGAPPLLARYELVHLPSASALEAVRRERAGRAPPENVVAVLADPVFGQGDPRAPEPGPQPAAGRAVPVPEYDRLPHTRAEADAILALAPPERSFAAFGFDADKHAVLGGRLSGFRLVHLATHGLLDEADPARSGLVLSQVDASGRPRDGFLRAHELYDLELAADLVVLSGCGTALGREVRGEGLVGLARAFLTAGASSLMVSLWRVSDRSTARLMADLYRRILGAGQTPAAALRAAQLTAWRGGAAPAEWAAFILQGDWRTAPPVDRDLVTAPPAVAPTPGERSAP